MWTAQEAISSVESDGLAVIPCVEGCATMTDIYRCAYRQRKFDSLFLTEVGRALVWLERSTYAGNKGKYIAGALRGRSFSVSLHRRGFT